jgi:serine/threonine protein kinase
MPDVAFIRAQRLFYLCGSARLITIACGIMLLAIIRRQQYRAQKGDTEAAQAVLLPMFQPMIMLLIASVAVEYFFLWIAVGLGPEYESITIMAQFSLNCFVQTGLVLFFCSHSLSRQTLQRAGFGAMWVAFYGFCCALVHQAIDRFWGSILFNGGPILLYMFILYGWLYRRKSIVPYLQFMSVYGLLWCAYIIVTMQWQSDTAYWVCLLSIAVMDVPRSFLWFVVMWNDTYFWRTGGTKFNLHLKRSLWKVARRIICRSSSDDLAPSSLGSSDDETGKYERHAMERIQFLKDQEAMFERRWREKIQSGNSSLAGSSAGAPFSASSPPTSPSLTASSSSASNLGTDPSASSSSTRPKATSRAGTSAMPKETLLIGGSDLLLSHSVQQLIEGNKHRFIDFALLRVEEQGSWIGGGVSSNVYAGFYRNYPVALKFFTRGSSELNAESIAAYAKETALAASLQHPHIVSFIGLCVRPPSIFIVMELCEAGSLFNLLPQIKYHPAYTYQAALTWCIQATSPIVYLHKNHFMHRDIVRMPEREWRRERQITVKSLTLFHLVWVLPQKSLNYLVTKRGEIKVRRKEIVFIFALLFGCACAYSVACLVFSHLQLTDFGLSRMFPAASRSQSAPAAAAAAAPVFPEFTPAPTVESSSSSSANGAGNASIQQSLLIASPTTQAAHSALRAPLLASPLASSAAREMTVNRAVNVAPHLLTRQVGSRVWMSPEQKQGDAYSYSSDVYSLTMVLWEILSGSAPFEDVSDEDLPGVLASGQLPPIPSFAPPEFRDLLLLGWSRDPAARPTAHQLHQHLKRMLRSHEQEHRLEPFDTSVFFQPVQASVDVHSAT